MSRCGCHCGDPYTHDAYFAPQSSGALRHRGCTKVPLPTDRCPGRPSQRGCHLASPAGRCCHSSSRLPHLESDPSLDLPSVRMRYSLPGLCGTRPSMSPRASLCGSCPPRAVPHLRRQPSSHVAQHSGGHTRAERTNERNESATRDKQDTVHIYPKEQRFTRGPRQTKSRKRSKTRPHLQA